ncbi:MAG: hypothetical protein Q9193_000150 [Seirophora villosa]
MSSLVSIASKLHFSKSKKSFVTLDLQNDATAARQSDQFWRWAGDLLVVEMFRMKGTYRLGRASAADYDPGRNTSTYSVLPASSSVQASQAAPPQLRPATFYRKPGLQISRILATTLPTTIPSSFATESLPLVETAPETGKAPITARSARTSQSWQIFSFGALTSLVLQRGIRPSPPISSKVAADIYDSDDAGPNRTPPLIRRIVNLRPSLSPELLPSPAKSSSPDRMSRSPRQKDRKRRRKTQASQGDAVLIGFLGGLNLPDVATRAGESPLNSASQSEADGFAQDMEPEDGESTVKKDHLVQTAQDALSVDDNGDRGVAESARRIRPKILTQSLSSTSRDSDRRVQVKPQGKEERRNNASAVKTENLDPALGGLVDGNHQRGFSPPLTEGAQRSSDKHGSSPLATSPRLRQFMASNGSETLPAIQNATPVTSTKSPNGQQSLPSISAQLGELVDGPSPNETLPTRSSFPMPNGIQSPPMSGISPRPNHYPSPQTRLNTFPTPYPATQPSPASTFGEVSPREPFRASHDPTSMSPPGKPGPPYYTSGRIAPNDELTPQSAESYAGLKGFAGGISPNGDHPNIEPGRPILPPLPGSGNLVTGTFKHVRANHTDRDMNDPRLRDVLAQRLEGGTRGRRRRFGG